MDEESETLTLDLDGWEGPLDLLLALARNQKVDLKQISILALVDQYLVFVEEAKALRLELAADYLVMAAWLAYLKSGLLLPRDPEVEPSRGVQISKGTLDVLMEAGWIRPAGRREVPGRPLLYATTPEFLIHFGLASRRDLPGIDDLRAAGLLDPIDLAMEQAGMSDDDDVEVENSDEDA